MSVTEGMLQIEIISDLWSIVTYVTLLLNSIHLWSLHYLASISIPVDAPSPQSDQFYEVSRLVNDQRCPQWDTCILFCDIIQQNNSAELI